MLTCKLLRSWIQVFSAFSTVVICTNTCRRVWFFCTHLPNYPFFETFIDIRPLRWAILFLIVSETIKTVMTGRLIFVSSEGLSHLVALYDEQWVLSTYSNPKSAEYKNIRGFYESDCVVYMKMKTKTIRCWLVNAKADIWFIQRYIYVYIALGFSICVLLRPFFKF